MKHINNKIMAIVLVSGLLYSCADGDFNSGLTYEKPDDVSMSDYLNQFGVLKSYYQKEDGSTFTLGTTISGSDIQAKDLAYSTLVSNFDLADLTGSYTPTTCLNDAGEYDFSAVTTSADIAVGGGISVFGGNLMSYQDQRTDYLTKLIAPTVTPAEKGNKVIDFEDYSIGDNVDMVSTTAPSTINATATGVITQGNETHGKVLTVTAAQGLPRIHVKLDDGLTLGDCTYVMMDMKLRAGMYGWGMRIGFDGQLFSPNQNAAGYGYKQDDKWKEEGILIKFVRSGENAPAGTVALPDDLLALNEFDFIIGSASGDWRADIDNIKFHYEKEGSTIERTDEEKKEILSPELEEWISGMVKAGGESITAWNIVSNPFDEEVEENTFNWSEYLGGSAETARTAVGMARSASENTLKLFVLNDCYQNEDMGAAADKLIKWVDEVESSTTSNGTNVSVDGYNIKLNVVFSNNDSRQEANEQEITELLTKLAATGKLIRISGLNVLYEDELGNYVTAANVLTGERERAGQYLAYIIKQYRELVPSSQQYGVSIASMTETSDGSILCPWTSNYERTEIYEGIVNGLAD